MILTAYLENSYFLLLLKKLGARSRRIKVRLSRIYSDSLLNKSARLFWDSTKINFTNSSFAKITTMGFGDYSSIVENSSFINSVFTFYKTCKASITDYGKASAIAASALSLKKGQDIFTIKNGVIVVITVIFTNIFFSILIGKDIEIFRLVNLFLILFMGLGVIFCAYKGVGNEKDSAIIQVFKKLLQNKKLRLK